MYALWRRGRLLSASPGAPSAVPAWIQPPGYAGLARESEPQRFETHIYTPDGVPVEEWHDDVAYDSGDLHAAGPRHRLHMLPDGWRYEAT